MTAAALAIQSLASRTITHRASSPASSHSREGGWRNWSAAIAPQPSGRRML